MSDTREWIREHPFTAVLGLWGSVLGATGVYLYKRQIPTQLKIIQARIIAQAGLIVGAVSLAGVTYLTAGDDKKPAASSWKLRNFEAPSTHINPHHHVVYDDDKDAPVPAAPAQLK